MVLTNETVEIEIQMLCASEEINWESGFKTSLSPQIKGNRIFMKKAKYAYRGVDKVRGSSFGGMAFFLSSS